MQGSIKYDKKINVWGCFCWNGVGDLYRIKGTTDADVYHYILQRKMVRSTKKLFGADVWIFQSDNDPKHTPNQKKNVATYKYFFSFEHIFVIPWI